MHHLISSGITNKTKESLISSWSRKVYFGEHKWIDITKYKHRVWYPSVLAWNSSCQNLYRNTSCLSWSFHLQKTLGYRNLSNWHMSKAKNNQISSYLENITADEIRETFEHSRESKHFGYVRENSPCITRVTDSSRIRAACSLGLLWNCIASLRNTKLSVLWIPWSLGSNRVMDP